MDGRGDEDAETHVGRLIGTRLPKEDDTLPDLRVLNLGAGVQSTTVILMAVEGMFGDMPDVAIFADTGWEPKAVYRHLAWLEEEIAGRIPIIKVSAGNIFDDVCQAVREGESRVAQPPFYVKGKFDKKGILLRKCTTEYKIQPIHRKIRELIGVKPGQRVPKDVRVEQWFGISLDEVQRMKVARDKWITNRYPLVEDLDPPMDRHGCLLWLERHGYPRPPKSSCVGCPFHSDSMWRDIRDNAPDEWAEAVEWDRTIRHGLPGVKGTAYVHKSLVPLEEADLRTVREKGQMTLWDDFVTECEGMCGV